VAAVVKEESVIVTARNQYKVRPLLTLLLSKVQLEIGSVLVAQIQSIAHFHRTIKKCTFSKGAANIANNEGKYRINVLHQQKCAVLNCGGFCTVSTGKGHISSGAIPPNS
jgi:hypothetical protein